MWNFIQTQILGMQWLNQGIGTGLQLLGIDIALDGVTISGGEPTEQDELPGLPGQKPA